MLDWYDNLQQSFQEPDLKFFGGESSNEATRRILSLVEDLSYIDNPGYIALVTHGNLTALLLNHISQNFGFNDWQNLSNPDVYIVESQLEQLSYKRIWK